MPRVGNAVMARARDFYMLELARGSSYIASALTSETRDRAIAEVIGEFRALYGDQEFALFRKLLVAELQRRGKPDAVAAVTDFKFVG